MKKEQLYFMKVLTGSENSEDILKVFGDRRCSILRELTKLHEEAIRGTVSDVVSHFEDKEPRGGLYSSEGSKERSDNPKPDLYV